LSIALSGNPSQSYEVSSAIQDNTGKHAPHLPQPDRPVLNLPTPEEWKAKLAFAVSYIHRRFNCLQTVTHPGSNHLMATQSGVKHDLLIISESA